MPPCKNDPKSSYKGTEPSPKGLGYCAHAEKVGTKKKGRNRKMWIIKVVAGKTKRWMPYKDRVNVKNIKSSDKSILCKNLVKYYSVKKLKSGKKDRKSIIGIRTRRGYIRPWISYNKFADKEIKVPAGYKLSKVLPMFKKGFCEAYMGKKTILSRTDDKIKHSGKLYITRGSDFGRIFLVSIKPGKKVAVYRISKNTRIPDNFVIRTASDVKKFAYLYTEKVCGFVAKRIFIGKSSRNPVTSAAKCYNGSETPCYGSIYDGNSILLEIIDKEYVYIGGDEIYKFRAYTNIVKYMSWMGHDNNQIPFAIDNRGNYYLMNEDAVVNIPALLIKKYHNPYIIYWNYMKMKYYDDIKEKMELKVMPIKGRKVIQKRLW